LAGYSNTLLEFKLIDSIEIPFRNSVFIRRLRPVPDGLDFWELHGGGVTGSDATAPGLAQGTF
jgi:hypothetical protein